MFQANLTNSIGVLVLTAVCSNLAHEARAQTPPPLYGVARITNHTPTRATLYYKYGFNGVWSTTPYVLQPGTAVRFPYRLDGNLTTAPDLYIRLDVDFIGNEVHIVEYALSMGNSPDVDVPNYGHNYSIRPVARGSDIRYIERISPTARVAVTDANSTRP